ncbi:MAG: DUF4350 domain-containing protein [Pseudomonadota bacterium]|nr:DUF4350 domain-containing protein [Pseudomonadota bacterium]
MKGSHIATVVILAALALLATWIARNTYWEETTVPMPMKGEALTNSMYAAQRLAEKLGATASARHSIDALPDANSIIYLSYWNWNLVRARREQLQRWVEAGGRLVTDRSLIGGDQELAAWAGITREVLLAEKVAARDSDDEQNDCADLDSETIVADPSTTSVSYFICGIEPGTRLSSTRRVTWLLSDAEGMQALRVEIGRGSFTMINGTPFDNTEIFDGDNALLFVAATRIDRGAGILFLSEEKSTPLLALMWLHGAPVVLLALGVIALALWRGSVRFGPPAGVADPARRSLAEQIVGTGRFTLRFGGGRALHAATVRALHETAHRYVSGYGSMHADARIAALAANTGMDESSLAEAVKYSGPRSASELRKVVALLETARRRIS